MQSQHSKRVEEFMRKAGQEVPDQLTFPEDEGKTRILRAKLIMEEALETINKGLGITVGFGKMGSLCYANVEMDMLTFLDDGIFDFEELADGVADLKVVSTGSLLAFGIKDDEGIQEEVDAANLRKFKSPSCPECGGTIWDLSNSNAPTCLNCEVVYKPEELGGYRREDGKWIKPANWIPPNIKQFLK